MLYNLSLRALILYASNLLFIIAYVLFGLSLWRYVHLTRHDIVKGLVKKTKGQNTSIDKDDMAHAMAQ